MNHDEVWYTNHCPICRSQWSFVWTLWINFGSRWESSCCQRWDQPRMVRLHLVCLSPSLNIGHLCHRTTSSGYLQQKKKIPWWNKQPHSKEQYILYFASSCTSLKTLHTQHEAVTILQAHVYKTFWCARTCTGSISANSLSLGIGIRISIQMCCTPITQYTDCSLKNKNIYIDGPKSTLSDHRYVYKINIFGESNKIQTVVPFVQPQPHKLGQVLKR